VRHVTVYGHRDHLVISGAIKATMRLKDVQQKLEKLARSRVEVGVIGDSKQAEIATYAEYGTSTIPARGFLSRPINANQKKYAGILGKISESVAKGGDVDAPLGRLGLVGVADVRAWVVAGYSKPENQPETIARKGSSTPLVDTGSLLGSLQYRVVNGDSK
jgi:hypothetical protein